MAEPKKLRFLVRSGYGGMFFAAGAVGDIPEPWASHFLDNGKAELADAPKKAEPKAEPKAAAKKPAAKGKKK